MCRKLVFLISFVLVLSLAGSAFATTYDYRWTNNNGNGCWNQLVPPYNWERSSSWVLFPVWTPSPPPEAESGEVLNISLTGTPTTRLVPLTIPAGYDANCAKAGWSTTIFGPDGGLHLDIYGSLGFTWTIALMQNLAGLNDPCNPDNDPNRSVINMFDGSELYGPYVTAPDTKNRCEVVCLGLSWWAAQPYVTMNMYGDSVVYTNGLILGGHLNLYGGTMDILNYVQVGTSSTYTVPDNLIRINIERGTLILPEGYTAAVGDWVDRGILKAYGETPAIVIGLDEEGGSGGPYIIINTIINPGRTTVTALPINPLWDIDGDGDVDFEDYAVLANQWMAENCDEPGWCGGADLNRSRKVDLEDLDVFTRHWLEGTTP
jgi:hypothetical protein